MQITRIISCIKKNFTAIDNYGARTTTPGTLLLPKLYCSICSEMRFSGLGFVGVFVMSRPRCLQAIGGYHCDFPSAENGLLGVL